MKPKISTIQLKLNDIPLITLPGEILPKKTSETHHNQTNSLQNLVYIVSERINDVF